MKKILLLVSVLFISFMCTACINNLAIQELNQMGKEYLDKGEVESAIGRFTSSVDLDENVFESRYNLGVAYIQKEDFDNAIVHLKKAIEIKPDSPDAYYSYAVALEGKGLAFENTEAEEAEEETLAEPLDEKEIAEGLSYVEEAIKMYEKYVELSAGAKDFQGVKGHIEELKETIAKYSSKEG